MGVLYDGDSYEASSEALYEASSQALGYVHFSGGNLLDEYRIHDRHTFGSLGGFKRNCWDFYKTMKVGRGQYMGWSKVKNSHIEAIDEMRSDIPKMTMRYDSEEEVLILKFMAGVKHEVCAGFFDTEFHTLVRTLVGRDAALRFMRTGRIQGTRRSKEPDSGWKPPTRTRESDKPSVVFEIGVSESLHDLQVDARHWLEDSQGQTRVAIIAAVDRGAESILIERWQYEQQQQPALRRQQPWNVGNPYARNHFPTLMQALTLEKCQIYTGPSLIIPADLAYDTMPAQVGPNDFQMSADILQFINRQFWSHVT